MKYVYQANDNVSAKDQDYGNATIRLPDSVLEHLMKVGNSNTVPTEPAPT